MSPQEPSLAWVGWIGGAFLLLFVVLITVTPDTNGAESSAAAYQSIENRRAADSISVLSLATADGTMPADTLARLESTLHANAFTIPHDAAHTRYIRILLDSADVLVASGLTLAARSLLANVGNLPDKADSVQVAG